MRPYRPQTRHKLALLLAISAASLTAGRLSAEPLNPVIMGDSDGLGAGAATIGSVSNGPGMDVTIDQNAERVFIDWQSFNIGTSDTVTFDQGGSHWIAVNRVTGGLGPTTIEGMLTAQGHVWIIDPAGIAFSSSATVDVGGLLATSANIDPGNFLAVTDIEDSGGFTFTSGGNDAAKVSNAGTIASGGLLALVAPLVENSGTLASGYGDVLLGGANGFRLSFTEVERPADGNHPQPFNELLVTDFIVEAPVVNDPAPDTETVPVSNTGTISGANVIVSAASVGGGAFINVDGIVEATNVGERSGDVVVLGGGDFVNGAADGSSGATEQIRISNTDITAAASFVAQGTSVDIAKGAGPGTLTAGSIGITATSGDVTSDTVLTATTGGIDIAATGVASVAALDAATTVTVAADNIDLGGKVSGTTSVTIEATGGDISGTDIEIAGGSVELTGTVAATDSVTITALSGDATLHDDLTSTGSVVAEALLGTASLKGVAADTTVAVTADDIDLGGKVSGTTSVTMEATGGDISGTDIDIEGGSVDLTGPVAATGGVTIKALTGDAALHDGLTSTGSAVVEALLGKASLKGVAADTTVAVTADDIDLDGKVSGTTSVTMEATGGDISGSDIDIEGGSVELTGPVAATDSVTITAVTGDATLYDSLTSTGSAVIEALLGTTSFKTVAADTTVSIAADDIDLDGKVSGTTSVTMEATGGDISGSDIDIEGGSVELTGPIAATGSATIKALTSDATLHSDLTSTGSVLVEATEGKATVGGIDAATTIDVTANDIEAAGDISATGALTMIAETLGVELQGLVEAASVYLEAAGDITALDKITSTTGAITIEAGGTASLTELDSATTIDVTAADIEISGDATSTGDATFKALTGDATLDGKTASTTGSVVVEAKLGKATVRDIESDDDTSITAGTIDVLGDIVAMDTATLQALLGDIDVQGSVTANGGLLLLDAAHGDAVINRISALTNVHIVALDLDLSGSISAGDEVRLTSLDSGTTVVLGGDGGTGSTTLRFPAGLTIDADELSRVSAGSLRIDAGGNDALLLSADFAGATLRDLSIGADASSQIVAAGFVQGLDALTLGYVEGLDDRRPGLILVAGKLGSDTATGRLGEVTLNSSQDIIIGPRLFHTYYEIANPSLAQLGKSNFAAMGISSGHVFIAADSLKLHAPGDIVQLNTGSGVDGRGLVFKVAAIDEGVIYPSGDGPDKVVLFGVVIRDDGTRVTSFSAGLEPRLLFPGTTDGSGNTVEEPLAPSDDYRFNLCIIGDPVSCSNTPLRGGESTAGAANSDPNPALGPTGLTFETGDEDEEDDDSDPGGAAATGNESLWGASSR